jgi:pectate lyase
MKLRFLYQAILAAVLLCQLSVCLGKEAPEPADPNRYLNAVREFADNVLKYGRDTYGPKHTPLFVDGLNIPTREPVKWIASNGDRWILSNLASQQNLLRTLDGLTQITGDPKYRQAAMEAIEYVFANLRSPNGLIYWGNVTAYDAKKDNVVGRGKPYSHVLKSNLPHYELMWQVNPEATKNFIESFWSAHVKDWSNLAMDRIASFTDVLEEPWKHTYTDGPAFLKSGGISFFTTGIDLAYAAAVLSKLSGDKEPLLWAKRLIRRYVRTRHPKTGISYWMYTTPSETVLDSYDIIMRKLVPGTTEFLPSEFPWSIYTNPLYRKTMYGQHMPTPSIPVNAQVSNWQSQFLVADVLAEEGNVFKQWALEELTAFGRASYRKEDNTYVPILTDGTNIEGYIVKVTSGMLGPSDAALEPLPVSPSDLWAYAMGYRVTNDAFMWEMARNISKGNEFGDIGATSRDRPQLDHTTNCSNPYALLAFLELYRGTGKAEFLHMAKRIGDNVLAKRFHKGYFVASKEHVYTKFDAIDSLAFLHLHLALVTDNIKIPQACPSLPYFYCSYRGKDWANDNAILYTRTESADPPFSLLEAVSLGDIEELKSILSKGTDVDGFESTFFKTALHEAAKAGHKEIVELLIAEDAQIDAKDSWPGLTPLHYAAEGGHIEVVKLLLTKGADIDAKITAYVRTTAYTTGDTPLHSAIRAGHKDIAELLIEKGADVNARNDQSDIPLYLARQKGHAEMIEILTKAAKGAKDN